MQPAFGDLVLRYMKRRGWSRVELARRLVISDTAVGDTIRGKSAPRFKHARRWVSVLGLSDAEAAEFLLEWQLALSPPAVRDLVTRLRETQR